MSPAASPPIQPDPAAELAEARARHLAQTREAQEITLSVMRASAARAQQALAQPDPDPKSDPKSDPESGPQQRQPDHVLALTRLNRALHQAMAFEGRTLQDSAAAPTPRRPYRVPTPVAAPAGPPDRRREMVRDPLHRAIKARKSPDQAHLLREVDQHVDDLLAADPADTVDPIEILAAVADHHGITIDPRTVSDELLGIRRPTQADERLQNPPLNL